MNIKELLIQPKTTETMIISMALDRVMMQDKGSGEERVGMHGSGVVASEADFCLRQHVLSFFFRGKEPFIPIGLKRIFKNGWSVHEKWQKLFEEAGVAVAVEQRGESRDWSLLFTPDAIIQIGKRKYVVEIKSVNTYQFKKMMSHPAGEKQLQLYMHQTGIPHGFVLCEDKNNQEIKVFPYEYDPEKVRPFVERMLLVKTAVEVYVETGKLPYCKCESKKDKLAERCAHCETCFGEVGEPLNPEEFEKMEKRWKENG